MYMGPLPSDYLFTAKYPPRLPIPQSTPPTPPPNYLTLYYCTRCVLAGPPRFSTKRKKQFLGSWMKQQTKYD